MTELALRNDPAPNLIHTTARDLADAARIAEVLVRTSFAPAHFRGKPEEGTVAILYGAAVGLDPMAAIQNIYVISGKPAMYARAMVAIVLAHGHAVWTEEAGPTKVIVCGQRKGSERVERSEWTIDRARQAGYLSNKKYDTEPEAMLYARASGDVSRRVAPDALLGMAANVEELEVAPSGPDGTPNITGVPRSSGLLADAGTPVTVTAERADPPITPAQLTALNAMLTTDYDLTDRADKLAFLSGELGRDISSSKDVTKQEASALLDGPRGVPVEEPPVATDSEGGAQ